jgi:hypothetical protein
MSTNVKARSTYSEIKLFLAVILACVGLFLCCKINLDVLKWAYIEVIRIFSVFHVRALYYTKKTNHQQMHKESFITNRNTLLHVSNLLGHLQGELFCYRYSKVALYS